MKQHWMEEKLLSRNQSCLLLKTWISFIRSCNSYGYLLLLSFSLSFYFFMCVYVFGLVFLMVSWVVCLNFDSKLDHPGLAKFVAAHAKPPNYMLFFEFYESHNLAEKLHVEEWSPSIDQVLMIAAQLGILLTPFVVM